MWFADEEGYDRLDFNLTAGHYRLLVTLVDEARVVVDGEFDVLRCVTAEDGCHSITFTNPATNPVVRITYSPGDYADEHAEESGEGGVVIVQPGQSLAVEIFHVEVAWSAHALSVDGEGMGAYAGGYYSQGPEQHCGPTMTRGVVGCAVDGRARVEAWLSPPDNRGVRFRVTEDYGEHIRGGRVGADGRVQTEVPVGLHIFRSYTDADVLPYDRAEFEVRPCVTAVQQCRAVKFSNPTYYPVEVTYWREGSMETTIRIGAGKSKTTPISPGTLTWRAAEPEAGELWKVKAGSGSVTIGPTCASIGETGGLADTGGPSALPWISLAGLVGGICLLRRRNRLSEAS